jgi:pyridoxine 5-phosphate synthase
VRTGSGCIEPYAGRSGGAGQDAALRRYAEAARAAQAVGLGGTPPRPQPDNLPVFLRAVPEVLEVSIGHALIADALELGLGEAVRRYLEAIRQGRAP